MKFLSMTTIILSLFSSMASADPLIGIWQMYRTFSSDAQPSRTLNKQHATCGLSTAHLAPISMHPSRPRPRSRRLHSSGTRATSDQDSLTHSPSPLSASHARDLIIASGPS